MKRPLSFSPSSSSNSSSSCIESPNANVNPSPQETRKSAEPRNSKRARTKKVAIAESPSTSKSRSSVYRGVTRHRWTGRFEAHLWDKTTWENSQKKKGRQIYLGAYDNEEAAARTYDLAALKYWGPGVTINFPIERYEKEMEEMQRMTNEEVLASLRRQSSGFARGVSKYRGVARHHHNGRWEARIGRVSGNKYLYLGTYSTEEEAAAAYDRAAIEFRGPHAVTNFDISNYADTLKNVLHEVPIKREETSAMEEEKPGPSSESREAQEKPGLREAQAGETSDAAQHQQPESHQIVPPSPPKLELLNYIDSQEMLLMDFTKENAHPWDLSLDMGLNSLGLNDIPVAGPPAFFGCCYGHSSQSQPPELLGGLDDANLGVDIDCFFASPLSESRLHPDAVSRTVDCQVKGGSLVAVEEKQQEASTSPSSSPRSTTTSVCSNI